jgi:putative membrane protein
VAVLKFITNLGRGALMGSAEVVPGVSGGTLALIVGIYQTLINSIANLVLSVRQLVGLAPGKASTKTAVSTFKSLPWRLLIPVAIGMGAAVILGAKLIEPLLDEQPIAMKALFFGLVIAGTYVPAHMVTKVGGWSPSFILLGLISAVFVFFLTGLPQGNMADPSLIVVFFSASIAICALVLPGVSGSFLLTVGMYDPTIAAVNDRNFAYLIVFALGAVLGLAIFVSLLKWLLENRARVTLVIITGLMFGSLRALWPWQGPERELLAPTDQIGIALLLFIAGAAFVAILLILERKFGETEEQKDLLEA